MNASTESYEGTDVHIATSNQRGVMGPHVDVFAHNKGQLIYACVVRKEFDPDENRWVDTDKGFDSMRYRDAVSRGKEIARARNLPLLVEPRIRGIKDNLDGLREVMWHPEGWEPQKINN
jgi:hypothetical protein|tara:strand:+ start:9085 stop:9441 length:357 start_codon:yes stop_codon:yes gene_type:complete